jgi:tRNA (guanine37-N1)-methyltransferase
MKFHILTLFPALFAPFRQLGVLGRAIERDLVSIEVHDLRAWAGNRWGQLDDEPYGGGAGMVLQAPPVLSAVRALIEQESVSLRTVVMTPRGRSWDQRLAEELAGERGLLLVCGRYEGFDERVIDILQPDELSLGDFVLGGGEVAAMAVIETVARLVPGVVGDPESVACDSFTTGLLDYPCYTRPAVVEGHEVPPVLVSGNHEAIRTWRLERAAETTVTRRPDLVKKYWRAYPPEVRAMIRRFAPELEISDGEEDAGPRS